jgi:hypothetical protein
MVSSTNSGRISFEPGIHLVMFLEAEDDLEVSAEAVPDELEVLRHIVHHGAQAGQASAHHCTRKKEQVKGTVQVNFCFLFKGTVQVKFSFFIERQSR